MMPVMVIHILFTQMLGWYRKLGLSFIFVRPSHSLHTNAWMVPEIRTQLPLCTSLTFSSHKCLDGT